MRTWVDRFPGRLERELEELAERDLQFELDESQLAEQGRVVLRGALPRGGDEVRLEIRYPDLFPYLRPQVLAPELDLPRHQNPNRKDLCLLDQSTREWSPSDTAAWLVAERVPYLLDLIENEERLREAEAPQGEPASGYFQYRPGTVVFVPEEALSLPEAAAGGAGRIGFSPLEPPQTAVRGAIVELVEKRGGGRTKKLAAADEALAGQFGAAQMPFRWARLEKAPAGNTAEAVLGAIETARPGFGSPPWQAVLDGQIAIAAAVFPEEVRQGVYEDAWIFAVRVRLQDGEAAYLVQGQRLSRPDLEERLPVDVRLGGRTVALFGLGSVGGGIALELVRSGLEDLRGMDGDTVEVGTTVRWPMGASAAGRLKTGALAQRIAADYPYTAFRGVVHMLGQSAVRTTGRERTEIEALESFLDGADLLIDATAEIGVQQLLAAEADARGLPQLYVSTTEGARGGLVARVVPGRTGCWMCLQTHLASGTIPAPAMDPEATVQPRGCGSLTFVGAGFDVLPLIAQGARVAAAMLSEGPDEAGKDAGGRADVFVCSFEGERPAPPAWTSHPLDPHPECPVCAGREP